MLLQKKLFSFKKIDLNGIVIMWAIPSLIRTKFHKDS